MRKSASLVALAAVGIFALGACSSTADAPKGGDAAAGGGLTSITVGVIPIVDVAAIYLGLDEGYFEEAGLDVTLELAQGGAAITPAVVSGEYQFGFSNVTSLLLGTANDVPVQLVAAGNFTTGTEPDIGGVIVASDSDIKSAADLEGRSVAVNTLNNINDTTVRKAVENDGGDPSKVNFTEMGFPDMPAAVNGKQIDAAQVNEPHFTRALNDGARVIAWNLKETDPDLMIAAYFTSTAFAAEHPETVEAFTAAMKKSLAYAEDNPDATRAILDSYTKIDPELRDAITLPRFKTDINVDSVQLLADLALKYGTVDTAIDAGKLLP